jgi:hypothetical protein
MDEPLFGFILFGNVEKKMTDTKQKPEPAPVPPQLTKEQLDRMVKAHHEFIHPGLTEEEFHDLYYGSGGGAR